MECHQIDASTLGSVEDLPTKLEAIYFDLEKFNLTGKSFVFLGLEEEVYQYFCKSVDDFVKQFEFTNAIRGTPPLKLN